MAQSVKRVFIDANVYFAGCVSKEGASSIILELARHDKIHIYANRLVLREAERNLRKKADQKALEGFYHFLKKTRIHIIPLPDENDLLKYASYIDPKDVPVLTSADRLGAEFLITLDRRHFFTPKVMSLPTKMKVVTTGDFLKAFLGMEKF